MGMIPQAADSKGCSLRAAVMTVRLRVFDRWARKLLQSRVSTEGFPSGQREQTVNLPALPSKVRILPPPLQERGVRGQGFRYTRNAGRRRDRRAGAVTCCLTSFT